MIEGADDAQAIDGLWNYDDPAASEQRFRELLAQVPAGSSAHVEVLTQIARSLGLQKRYDEANSVLDDAAGLLRGDMARDGFAARILLERGRVLNSSGRAEEAAPLFEAAWSAAHAAGEDFYAVDAAHMLGICLPPGEQMAWHVRALELAQHSEQPRARGWLASLYNNIGWAHHDAGEHEQALGVFQTALELREARGEAGPIRIARWCVARGLRALGRTQEALDMQRALLEELTAAGEQDPYVQEEIEACVAALGQATGGAGGGSAVGGR